MSKVLNLKYSSQHLECTMFSINITYNFLSFSMKPRVGLGREMEMEGCEAGEREQGGKLGRRGVHPILATPQASSSLSPAVTDINGLLVSNLFFVCFQFESGFFGFHEQNRGVSSAGVLPCPLLEDLHQNDVTKKRCILVNQAE